MSTPRTPRVANALLTRTGVDPALIDDINDEYAAGRSAWWLWRQVVGSMLLAGLGRAREPRPFRRRHVSLTGLPAGTPVGGLGLATLIGLVSVVSPASWWLMLMAVVGGIALGGVLIYARRPRNTGTASIRY